MRSEPILTLLHETNAYAVQIIYEAPTLTMPASTGTEVLRAALYNSIADRSELAVR